MTEPAAPAAAPAAAAPAPAAPAAPGPAVAGPDVARTEADGDAHGQPYEAAPGGGGVPWARLAIVAVVVALAAMWIYAFFFAPSASPDLIPDRAWAAAGEQSCATTARAIEALPPARSFRRITPLGEAIRQRAAVAATATDLVADRISALRAIPVSDEVTRSLVTRWLADYDTYLADRKALLKAFADGENAAFAETSDGGSPNSLRMDTFARTNHMASCQVPQDLG